MSTGVGGNGVVAVLRNGKGPIVMWRSVLDALPVKEETGLPYASAVTATDDSGRQVPVMHACGHDIHMTTLVGLARGLKTLQARWSGTSELKRSLGDDRVVEVPPVMGSEDFTYYGRERIPIFMFNLGTTPRERIDESVRPEGRPLPSLHSSQYAPEREGSIRTGVRAALVAVLGLL